MFNRKSTARVPFIFATIFLDSLGIGILIPIMPDVIRRFSSDPVFISTYFGYFIASYALMQFVASPTLGSLSDRFGRRPVLLSSLFGAGLDYLIMAFAPNLWILFLGRIISGLTGASFTVASAYMADISDDKNRSANFGLIGAAFGFGFIIGPALGGFAGSYSPQAPFIAAAVLNLLNFFFGLFLLPESLAPELRRKIDLKQLNPFSSLKRVLSPSPLLGLIVVYILLYLAGHVHMSIWTLYTEAKFGWTPSEIGISLAIVGITAAIVQGGLTRVVIPKLGEARSMLLGCFVYMMSYLGYALAPMGWMMYAILIPGSLAGIGVPALQSMITKNTPANQQGELQGSLVGLGSLTAVIAPLMYTWLFATFSAPGSPVQFAGAPYIAAAMISVVSVFIALRSMKKISVS
ncbi:MAG TPA: TCR/Tet family MFS transporter [Bdellovibrionales bacterium]|nr:TCR/Tet family MFS transporter [Bdellovibrionales bacterium]